jgi:hypothetical protein
MLNHKTLSQYAWSTERRKLEDGRDHSSKRRSAEDSSHLRRVDKETVPSGKREHGAETDFKRPSETKIAPTQSKVRRRLMVIVIIRMA